MDAKGGRTALRGPEGWTLRGAGAVCATVLFASVIKMRTEAAIASVAIILYSLSSVGLHSGC
eukprot:3201312-Pyramimonas_sp.AAC.1